VDAGFPRNARLTRPAQFRAVFAGAQRYRNRYFTILVRPDPMLAGARLGMAIPKKLAPKATDRNRLKRLIRERFRHARQRLDGLDAVVMIRSIACHTDNAILMTALDDLWQRISDSCAES
jgi:ribonuclease P protein component